MWLSILRLAKCTILTGFSALLLINAPYLDGITPARLTDEQSRKSRQLVLSELEKTQIIADEFLNGERGTVDETCPLFLGWLYRAAATATFIYQETNDTKHREQSLSVQKSIQDISQRWRVAGMLGTQANSTGFDKMLFLTNLQHLIYNCLKQGNL